MNVAPSEEILLHLKCVKASLKSSRVREHNLLTCCDDIYSGFGTWHFLLALIYEKIGPMWGFCLHNRNLEAVVITGLLSRDVNPCRQTWGVSVLFFLCGCCLFEAPADRNACKHLGLQLFELLLQGPNWSRGSTLKYASSFHISFAWGGQHDVFQAFSSVGFSLRCIPVPTLTGRIWRRDSGCRLSTCSLFSLPMCITNTKDTWRVPTWLQPESAWLL